MSVQVEIRVLGAWKVLYVISFLEDLLMRWLAMDIYRIHTCHMQTFFLVCN
jgi:hypothetical protein